jgi:hypothetical protein
MLPNLLRPIEFGWPPGIQARDVLIKGFNFGTLKWVRLIDMDIRDLFSSMFLDSLVLIG